MIKCFRVVIKPGMVTQLMLKYMDKDLRWFTDSEVGYVYYPQWAEFTLKHPFWGNGWVILWSLQPCHPKPKGKSEPFKIAERKATICSPKKKNTLILVCLRAVKLGKKKSQLQLKINTFNKTNDDIYWLHSKLRLLENAWGWWFFTVQVPEPHPEIRLRRCCCDPMSRSCVAKRWLFSKCKTP